MHTDKLHPIRCAWVSDDPLYRRYHDHEWGVPLRDEQRLFELLMLEGLQAGLAWITVLKKREALRAALEGFVPERLAACGEADLARWLADPRLIRHRGKLAAMIGNARAWLALHEAGLDPIEWLWGFVGGAPRHNAWACQADVPSETPESKAMSQALKAHGFRFVGPTICQAFMQASGMVNDHTTDCFRHGELRKAAIKG